MSGLRNQLEFLNLFHYYKLGHHLADWIETLFYVKDLLNLILFLKDILLIFIRISFCEHVFIVELFSFTSISCPEVSDH